MNTGKIFIGCFITALTLGCGKGGSAPAESPQAFGGSDQASAPAGQAPAGAFGQAGPPPAATAAPDTLDAEGGGDFAPESEETARERQGLGTSWGENRVSRVSTAPFFRDQPDNPFALAKIFYNDAAGARAMARRRGFTNVDDSVVSFGGGALTVTILDASGRPFNAFRSGGRSFVVGEDGERYVIRIENHTGTRMEVVASVDGLDVIDGKAGSLSKRGYILGPFASLDIDGFRRSMDVVASFRFGAVGESYAERKGKGRNVGVIGVAFFHEEGSDPLLSRRELRRRESADPFPNRFARPPIHRIRR